MVVQRGFKAPSSYHVDRLRAMPVGYFYDVITNGFATMPDYAAQVAPADRWAIAAYIRTLQYSAVRAGRGRPGRAAAAARGERRACRPRRRTTDERAGTAVRRRRSAGSSARPSVAAGVFLLATALGLVLDREQFLRSWLLAFLFWLGIAVGSLGLALLNQLTGGLWGVVPRRLHEAAARTIPLLAIALLPLLLGAATLYPWAGPEAAADEMLRKKAAYLNLPFFAARSRPLLRGLGRARVPAERAGRGSRTPRPTPCARGACAASSAVGLVLLSLHHHLRRHRLGHVARAPLVLDHLRRAVHRGLDAQRALLHDRPARGTREATAVRPRARARRRPRPRQAPARLHHALGLRQLLAVPDRLVGQHQRGDALLRAAAPGRLAAARDRVCSSSTSRCRSRCCSRARSSATPGRSPRSRR